MDQQRMIGRVKQRLPEGFGFILTDSKDRYFFHRDNVESPWHEFRRGAIVEFTPLPATGENNPRAIRVVILDPGRTEGRTSQEAA